MLSPEEQEIFVKNFISNKENNQNNKYTTSDYLKWGAIIGGGVLLTGGAAYGLYGIYCIGVKTGMEVAAAKLTAEVAAGVKAGLGSVSASKVAAGAIAGTANAYLNKEKNEQRKKVS